jgi:hypothetical protein
MTQPILNYREPQPKDPMSLKRCCSVVFFFAAILLLMMWFPGMMFLVSIKMGPAAGRGIHALSEIRNFMCGFSLGSTVPAFVSWLLGLRMAWALIPVGMLLCLISAFL